MPWETFVASSLSHDSIDVPPGPPGETPKEAKAREEAYKIQQMAFSPVVYRGIRTNDNVESVAMAVADLDHASLETFAAALEYVQAQGLECLVYSGWSYGLIPGEVSARFVVPFAEPIPAAHWPTVWPRAMAAMGLPADPQCKDPARLYFLPATPAYRHHLAFAFHLPGKPLAFENLAAQPLNIAVAKAAKGQRAVERDEIVQLQKRLVKSQGGVANALKHMLEGDPWETRQGFRDDTLFRVCGSLANTFPDVEAESFLPFFQASFSQFPEPAKEAAKFLDKFNRLVDRNIEAADKEELAHLTARNARIREAFRGQRTTPYTAEEMASVPIHEWIIQYRSSWYFKLLGFGYIGPFGVSDATPAAHTYLSPTSLKLSEVTLTGDLVDRKIENLTMEYGSIASFLVVDMTGKETTYDPVNATIEEAPCPLRKIDPIYSPAVADWLKLLAGPKYDKLELWLSYATQLDTPCSALFLEGDPGAGKSLLGLGLSYLFTTNGPTRMSQVMGNFNQALAACPIVLADETAPTDFRGKARTAELREIIQATTRPYTRKNLPDGTLKGAVRIIIASNNARIFEGEDTLTPADIEAITGRILHIKVGPRAARFLAKEGWTQGQGREEEIASHVLWLTKNAFKPLQAPRFLVADASDLARSIATSTTLGSAVAHWLVSALLNRCMRLRAAPEGSSAHLLRVVGGKLYVSPRCLIEHWNAYETNVAKHVATSKRVVAGLHAFSSGPEEIAGGIYYPIRVPDLVAWAETHGHALGEEILTAMLALDDLTANKAPEYLPQVRH